MGMIGNLARVTDEQLRGLYQRPEAIQEMLYPDMQTAQPTAKQGFFSRLFGRKAASQQVASAATGGLQSEDQIDLDKAWHTLHFLFTGSAWEGEFPQGFLVSCGRPVGDVDVGYGPARGFTSEEVAQISAYLGSLNGSKLRTSFDPKRLLEEKIYPEIHYQMPISEDDWGYISGAFNRMENFIQDTAKRRMALLIYIN